ncbi:MAG: HAD family hydrolase [Eubacteriales bacterium]|nr:HAD family hydrolase [Eubacteriales bacterium]
MLKAILFDLDGTLLPMDNEEFTKTYLYLLSQEAKQWGYTDRDAFVKGIWNGVKYMYKNDGTNTNDRVFWQGFSDAMGKDFEDESKKFESFYKNIFTKAQVATRPAPLAAEAVKLAREKAEKVVLATNPIFPLEAYKQRLAWIGLNYEDFDLVTDYELSHFTKPNPKYYEEILEKISAEPKECLMIGNDCTEDMLPALSLSMDFFLQTDDVINKDNIEITCKHGGFEEMVEFLKQL